MKPGPKVRLDQLLRHSGLANTREKASALILAGKVLVENVKVTKPGAQVLPNAEIKLLEPDHPYVSRGGLKMEQALRFFGIRPAGLTALDIGASTGGFTDCLLQQGAEKVYALDVGKNQLDWSLKTHPKVVEISECNFRHFAPESISEPIDLITVDVSFISLAKIFPNAANFCTNKTHIIALFKPQFESGREHIEKGGVVKNQEAVEAALKNLENLAEKIGLRLLGRTHSETTGKKKKNREILTLWQKNVDDRDSWV